jgi:uncharacterized membrane protein
LSVVFYCAARSAIVVVIGYDARRIRILSIRIFTDYSLASVLQNPVSHFEICRKEKIRARPFNRHAGEYLFMESRAKVLGHAAHQMLVVFPLGLLPVAVIFDIVGMFTKNDFWYQLSFYMIAAGLIGGLAAAIPGLIDYLAIPSGTRAKRVGLLHGGGNLIVIVLFALSWWLRYRNANHIPDNLAITIALLAVGLSLATAWLGGELVDRLGVGVDDGAHLDAPNSLSNQPIRNKG